jgi:hypothetical protein
VLLQAERLPHRHLSQVHLSTTKTLGNSLQWPRSHRSRNIPDNHGDPEPLSDVSRFYSVEP